MLHDSGNVVWVFFPGNERHLWCWRKKSHIWATALSHNWSHQEVFYWEMMFCGITLIFESVVSDELDVIRVYRLDLIQLVCLFHLSFAQA